MVDARMERKAAIQGAPYTIVLGERALSSAHVDLPQLKIVLQGVQEKLPNRTVRIVSGDLAELPTTRSWPQDVSARSDLIIASSPVGGLGAVISDGRSVIFGDVAEELANATREIDELTLLTGDAEHMVLDYMSRLRATA